MANINKDKVIKSLSKYDEFKELVSTQELLETLIWSYDEKFIKKMKTGLDDAKSTLDSELNISEMKDEANKFKSQIQDTKASLSIDSKIDLGLKDILKDDLKEESSVKEIKSEVFEEKSKEQKISFKKEDKFKVKLDDKKEENA